MGYTERELRDLKSKANSKKKEHKRFITKLKSINPKKVDELFQDKHHEVFENINCLECANCCKTTGPLFTDNDINRIAKLLKLKSVDFVEKYLRVDEDNDYVLQQVPCSFLGEDNYCSIYAARPKACKEYPHTNRKKQTQILDVGLKNTAICPAVFKIFEDLKNDLS